MLKMRCLTMLPPDRTAAQEVRLFAKLRNEALRLPYFLDYHRGLGVARFILVDNGSTDGTLDLLAREPDIHLFHTPESFRAAGGGQTWLNQLLDRFGTGGWCLTLDADELLVFAESERVGLAALCAALESEGAEAFACTMIDMYPETGLAVRGYRQGESLLAAAAWFDPGPYREQRAAECPYHEIYGGVRQRVFYPSWHGRYPSARIADGLLAWAQRAPGLGAACRWRPKPPPNLAKVPLVRWRAGLRYLASTHKIDPVALSRGRGGLLHFKFFDDFVAKAITEAARGEYYDGASEYRRYAAAVARNPGLTLRDRRSLRFAGTGQLAALGLVRHVPQHRPGDRG